MKAPEVVKFEYNNIAIIERLSDAMGVTKDIDLAEAIGESQSKVASWKRIKSPPAVACFEVAMHTGKSIEWLLLGTEQVFGSKPQAQGEPAPLPEQRGTKAYFSTQFLKAMQTALDNETLYRGEEVSDAEIRRLGIMLYNEVYHADAQHIATKAAFADRFLALLQKALNAGTFDLGKDVSSAELKRNGMMFYNSLQHTEAGEKRSSATEQV